MSDHEPTHFQVNQPAASKLRLYIETLVLEGFPRQDVGRIVHALEQELTRLYMMNTSDDAGPKIGVIDYIDAGSFEVIPSASPDAAGKLLARVIYGGLKR